MGKSTVLRNRLIPILSVLDGGLVKTVRFRDPRYIGDPINAIRIFNEKQVDELALVDIGRSKSGLGPNLELIRDAASECFMPLGYGGGVRDLSDAKAVFKLGVEKVIIRTAAAQDLQVVRDVARYSGSSSVCISVDIRRTKLGRRQIFAPGSPVDGRLDWQSYLSAGVSAGAGEILLTAVDRDGTMSGLDVPLIAEAASVARVPLVATGGVGSLDDVRSGVQAGANAIAAGSFFVYHGPRKAVLITYPQVRDLEALLGTV